MTRGKGRGGRIRRQDLVDPYRDVPHIVRLAEAEAVDLRDNLKIRDVGGGYVELRPRDPHRTISPPSGSPTPRGKAARKARNPKQA